MLSVGVFPYVQNPLALPLLMLSFQRRTYNPSGECKVTTATTGRLSLALALAFARSRSLVLCAIHLELEAPFGRSCDGYRLRL